MWSGDRALLAQLKSYAGWTPELQTLAEDASRAGVLRAAYDYAEARLFGGARSSSNSSVTFQVVDGPMNVRTNPKLCELLREALLDALGR
jgi:hypothetical protein